MHYTPLIKNINIIEVYNFINSRNIFTFFHTSLPIASFIFLKPSVFKHESISCFMLSLAGAPLFAGFWAKFNIILISYKSFGLILPACILIGTLISFYYYLKVIKIIFSERQLDQKENINFSFINKAIIIVCAIVTIILGVYPNILQNII